jgi:hypothetical protein
MPNPEQIQTSFRLDSSVKTALKHLSELTKTSQNEIANAALRQYVVVQSGKLASDLEETARKLRSYQSHDPDFERSIEAFAAAEASVDYDPAQGETFEENPQSGSIVRTLVDG